MINTAIFIIIVASLFKHLSSSRMKLRDSSDNAIFDDSFDIQLLEWKLIPLEGKINNSRDNC
ncbi:hypothetical protein IEQ34_021528 [Dendrobium chrysotoxum]|uniref:Uncharacterized protein n=1 Tax=Dendrobium chrysotoxum TaxID=161865 RepID=A0AAV7G3B4_DENCH|nr:hypothetical protein IEQ34_021528 [Dendrobium chrysotoxum]